MYHLKTCLVITITAGAEHQKTFGSYMADDTNPDAVPEKFQDIFELGSRGPTAAVTFKVKREKNQKSCDKAAEVRKYAIHIVIATE